MTDIHERGYWLSKAVTDTHDWDRKLAAEIVKVFKELKIKSAVDIGCGNGGYTKYLIESGIPCRGYDGSPLTSEITGGLCDIMDFSVPVNIGKYDFVLSLEVGEHIPAQYEQNFINNLVKTSTRYIVLSWGVVGQGGLGHVNCRNNDYVIAEMEKRGFAYNKLISERLRINSTFPWFANTVMTFEKGEAKPILDVFKGYERSLITVVITACGRTDLLKRTIDSFNQFNNFPIHEFIIIDDSGNKAVHRELQATYPDYTLILNPKNIGLVKSIDKAYERVSTPYIFHAEEDWEFVKSGFMEKSLEVLLVYPKIMQVWIRSNGDTNGHPIEDPIYYAGNTSFMLMATNVGNGGWHGFTWNPGLRRLSDYKEIGPFDAISPKSKAGEAEMMVGIMFYKAGFRAAILRDRYVYHIGIGPKNYSLV